MYRSQQYCTDAHVQPYTATSECAMNGDVLAPMARAFLSSDPDMLIICLQDKSRLTDIYNLAEADRV